MSPPPSKSRLSILQSAPDRSIKSNIRSAIQISFDEWLMKTVYCGFCGGRIAADDVFCAHCGARQPLAGVGSSALLHTVRPTAKLVVTGTTELDASFILQKDSNLLGRTDPHSNIFPEIDLSRFDPETKVSRRHARMKGLSRKTASADSVFFSSFTMLSFS